MIDADHLPPQIKAAPSSCCDMPPPPDESLDDVKRRRLIDALKRSNGNQSETARRAGYFPDQRVEPNKKIQPSTGAEAIKINTGTSFALFDGRVGNQYLHVDSLNLTLTSCRPGTMKCMPIVPGLPFFGTSVEW
jgi:hypothetical protein